MRSFRLLGLTALVLILGAGTALAQVPTPPYAQTAIVPSGPNAVVNGNNLLATLALIPATAGPTEPWVLELDSGIYDLQNNQLVLRDFVTIAGAGRNATFLIGSNNTTGTAGGLVQVPAGVDTELINLTVRNVPDQAGFGIANNSTEFKLTQVNIEVEAGELGVGFVSFAGNPRLSGVFARVSAQGVARGFQTEAGQAIINEAFSFVASFGADNVGFFATGDSTPLIQDLAVVVLGAEDTNFGLVVNRTAAPRVTNARITASGGLRARAASIGDFADPVLKEVVLEATNEQGEAIGLRAARGSFVEFLESGATAEGSPGVGISSAARVQVDRSTVEGNSQGVSVTATGGSVVLGASRLVNGFTLVGGSTIACAQSYDGNYVDLGPACI